MTCLKDWNILPTESARMDDRNAIHEIIGPDKPKIKISMEY